MLKLRAVKNIGGPIHKDQVLYTADKYEKYHTYYGGQGEERKSNYTDMVCKFYHLVTTLYEHGWGKSFHFAPRWKDETLQESIKRHEHFIASQLGLKPGQKVLDVGCGIGGPLREIARFSSVSITGLNIHEYQIIRGMELNRIAGVDNTCSFVKGDFMKMPFPENSFDAVYAIDATCHAPDVVGCYKEIYRVLKPGQHFAVNEWCMTDAYDPNNQQHQKIKAEIELGNALPDIRSTSQCYDALRQAGFEIILDKDLNVDSALPWYLPLETHPYTTGALGLLTKIAFLALEAVGFAPKGSHNVYAFLKKAGEGLVKGGKREIFTAVYFVLARKPLTES